MTNRSYVEWHPAVARKTSACPPLAGDVFAEVVNGGSANALRGPSNSSAIPASEAVTHGRDFVRDPGIRHVYPTLEGPSSAEPAARAIYGGIAGCRAVGSVDGMSVLSPDALSDGLVALGAQLRALTLELEVPGVTDARRARDEIVAQIDDYLLPRLASMEAPLLIVVGGSTGAGKSTLVNSLVGAAVSPSGVLRPTTRAPVLVCHPDDLHWFEDDRVLPAMSRTTGRPAGPGGLELAPASGVPAGVALLDSPDIDSVVEANRALSRQLLAAADAWLFVTTAARYADAVPWELLQAARDRGTALSLVLDRVPSGAGTEIVPHLGQMLADRGLAGTEILVVPETALHDDRLPAGDLAPVRRWLDALGADAEARAGLIRRTIGGALESLPRRVGVVGRALAEQESTAAELGDAVDRTYARALDEVDDALKSGALLRGEVLARWHEVVGTGDLMRGLESRLSWVRDRVRSLVTGGPRPEAGLQAALRSNVDAIVHAAADRAAERAAE